MRTNSYPLIFKKKVVEFKNNNEELSASNISSIFGINRSTLFNWCKLSKENKLMEKKTYTKNSKITPMIKCYIKSYICSRVIFFYRNLLTLIKKKYNTEISKSSLYRTINNMNITRKKIKKIDKKNIISIDETSIDTYISADYGWSKKGDKITETKKTTRIRYTIISAINRNKIIHNKYIKGSANAEIFLQFIKELKNLINNDYYILLDNARIHHAKIVTKYIKDNKIKFIFNVPYCPEFNPIEKVFSMIKHILKTKKNNHKKLLTNIKNSFNKISKNNLNNFYDKSLEF